MAVPVLIMGNSGTGKSTSVKTVPREKLAYFNCSGKMLPFRGEVDQARTKDIPTIQRAAMETERPIVVVDDFGYCITDLYMRLCVGPERMRDQFEPYKIIASQVYSLVDAIHAADGLVNAEKVVYITMHTETDQFGEVNPMTVGKLLNEKINVKGIFDVLLLSTVEGDSYQFVTRGFPPAHSGEIFDSDRIPNDLWEVDKAIRSFMGWEPLEGGEDNG